MPHGATRRRALGDAAGAPEEDTAANRRPQPSGRRAARSSSTPVTRSRSGPAAQREASKMPIVSHSDERGASTSARKRGVALRVHHHLDAERHDDRGRGTGRERGDARDRVVATDRIDAATENRDRLVRRITPGGTARSAVRSARFEIRPASRPAASGTRRRGSRTRSSPTSPGSGSWCAKSAANSACKFAMDARRPLRRRRASNASAIARSSRLHDDVRRRSTKPYAPSASAGR